MSKETIGTIGQFGSMCLLIVGLVVEVYMKAHIGFILLTAGGLVWGISTKLRGK